MTPADRIVSLFSELTKRWSAETRASGFTYAERAVWYWLNVAADIEMCGFVCIFDQGLTRQETIEFIHYCGEMGFPQHASLMREILDTLIQHDFYDAEGQAVKMVYDLPQPVQDFVESGSYIILPEYGLPTLETELCRLLDAENR